MQMAILHMSIVNRSFTSKHWQVNEKGARYPGYKTTTWSSRILLQSEHEEFHRPQLRSSSLWSNLRQQTQLPGDSNV